MKRTFFNVLVDQWTTVPPVQHVDLAGKTVVIVGANTGLGLEAAKHFARMNPSRLILACRNQSKGKAAVSEIESSTTFKSCELWRVDLADFSSVTSFASRFQQDSGRLDILVMNAGVVNMEYQETIDGWESTFQVNHLGTALLSLLLLPRLVDTGQEFGGTSRLVIVTSDSFYWTVVPEDIKESRNPIAKFNNASGRDPLVILYRYSHSKLLNVLFVRALQDRLPSVTPLTVNAVSPGISHSRIMRNIQGVLWKALAVVMMKLLAWTSEQGSRQLIYAAIGEQDNEDHMKGACINKAAVVEPSNFVISEQGKKMQDNVWRETIEILTKEVPQLSKIVEGYLM